MARLWLEWGVVWRDRPNGEPGRGRVGDRGPGLGIGEGRTGSSSGINNRDLVESRTFQHYSEPS